MTAEWTETGFVASQGGLPTIRTAIAIDPARGENKIWDDATRDVVCASRASTPTRRRNDDHDGSDQ